jgi:predicted nucleic acid-binding protein
MVESSSLKAIPTRFFVFDTSVLIDQGRTSRLSDIARTVGGVVRHSAVAIAELYRGARDRKAVRAIDELVRHATILVPTREMWFSSGRILARLAGRHSITPDTLRRLHFDLLIALTARSIGATVVTTDRDHFELLRTELPFSLVVW